MYKFRKGTYSGFRYMMIRIFRLGGGVGMIVRERTGLVGDDSIRVSYIVALLDSNIIVLLPHFVPFVFFLRRMIRIRMCVQGMIGITQIQSKGTLSYDKVFSIG